MIPESAALILACARIGAPHNIVFSGFSSHALAERINYVKSKFVLTADIGRRRGGIIKIKDIVD